MQYIDGDFVERAHELEPVDIVTLDRVVCCYPDMPAMLGSAAPLARRTLGLIIPRGTRFIRAGVGLVNFIQRLGVTRFASSCTTRPRSKPCWNDTAWSRRHLREGLVWRVIVFGRRTLT